MANLDTSSSLSSLQIESLCIQHDSLFLYLSSLSIPSWLLLIYREEIVIQEEKHPQHRDNLICPCDEESREDCPCFNGHKCTCTQDDFDNWD